LGRVVNVPFEPGKINFNNIYFLHDSEGHAFREVMFS
jgi:hypothetical protein